MQFCDASRRTLRCGFKAGIPDKVTTGERVIFRNPRVGTPIKLNVDISSTSARSDLYLLIDGTGSFSGIPAIKSNFLKLAGVFEEDADIGYGIGVYRDEAELTGGFKNIQTITTSIDTARNSLRVIGATGGRDTEEANLNSLYQLATTDVAKWRPGARRIVVMFGDAPGHEPSCVGGRKLTRVNVIEALKKAGITVVAANYFGGMDDATSHFGCGGGSAGRGQTTAIVTATGGKIFPVNDDDMVVTKLTTALRSITKRVTLKSTTCTKHVTLTYKPVLPAILPATSSVVEVTFTPRRSICTTRMDFSCAVIFAESGAPTDPLNMKFLNNIGC